MGECNEYADFAGNGTITIRVWPQAAGKQMSEKIIDLEAGSAVNLYFFSSVLLSSFSDINPRHFFWLAALSCPQNSFLVLRLICMILIGYDPSCKKPWSGQFSFWLTIGTPFNDFLALQLLMRDSLSHKSSPNQSMKLRSVWMPQFSAGPISWKMNKTLVSMAVPIGMDNEAARSSWILRPCKLIAKKRICFQQALLEIKSTPQAQQADLCVWKMLDACKHSLPSMQNGSCSQ